MRNYRKIRGWIIIDCIVLIFIAVSCNPPTPTGETRLESTSSQAVPTTLPALTDTAIIFPTDTTQPSQTPLPTHTAEPSLTSTATLVPTPTNTPLPSPTPEPSLTPTYAILRGTVLEQANCRYGPGAAYLYKYGLYPGNNIEIIGRNELGSWIVIQAIGGTNPCWVKASLLEIQGDVMSVAPAELPLPMSPYYGPVNGVFAERYGNEVIISWNPITLRAGDDSLQYPYLIEAWLCQNGQLTFNPIGSWEITVTVTDEAGCSEPSHARVYGVEKHGYTLWVSVPWPAP